MELLKINIKKYDYEETLETYAKRTYYKKNSYKYIKINDKTNLEEIINYIESLKDYYYSDSDYSFISEAKYTFKLNNKKISKKDLLIKLKNI